MSRRPDESQNGAPVTRVAGSRLAYVLQAGKDRQATIDAKNAVTTSEATSEAISEYTSESIGFSLFGKGPKKYNVLGSNVTIDKVTQLLMADFKRTASKKSYKERAFPYEHLLDSGVGVFATVTIQEDEYSVDVSTATVLEDGPKTSGDQDGEIDDEMTYTQFLNSLLGTMRRAVLKLLKRLEAEQKAKNAAQALDDPAQPLRRLAGDFS